MRVALCFTGCHRRGGVERVILECANFLAARGHECHLFAAERDDTALDARVVRHEVAVPAWPLLWRLERFRARSAAMIDAAGPFDAVGAFGATCPAGGVYWAQSVHAQWMETAARRRGPAMRLRQRLNPFHPYILRLERHHLAGRRYRRVVALTADVRDDLMRLYGVPEADIAVIPNGFSPTEFSLDAARRRRPEMRRRLGYGDADRVVVFVANEVQRKGLVPLMRAIASLSDERVRLLAVGRLSRAEVEPHAQRLGLAGRVALTGPTSDVAGYYAAADVFALPTQYEAWGLVIVEAMACGLPALTSRLAGASVAIDPSSTGRLLDDPDDDRAIAAHLRDLLDGRHAAPDVIADSVARFTWAQVLPAYERVLESSPRPATEAAHARA